MRTLLTGASGFIGGHAARALVGAGHELRVLIRPTSDLSGLAGLPCERFVGDLTTGGLEAACDGVDTVVHVAGLTTARRADDLHAVNGRATASLARAAAEAGVGRFIYLSSLAALGPSRDGAPEDPASPRHPVTPYGESKAAGEVEVLAYADRMAVQILRPPAVYGPGDTGLLPFFKMARLRFITRLGDGHNRTSLIYGPELADAIVALAGHEPGPTPLFHISDAEGPYTWRRLIAGLGEAFGHRVVTIPVPALGFAAYAGLAVALARLRRTKPMLDGSRVTELRQRAWVADSRALTALTGWTARTALADGLAETVVWYRRHGWI